MREREREIREGEGGRQRGVRRNREIVGST